MKPRWLHPARTSFLDQSRPHKGGPQACHHLSAPGLQSRGSSHPLTPSPLGFLQIMAATDTTPNILGTALPWFRKDVPSTGKVATGYKPGSGRFGLYADHGPPNPGSHRGIAGGRVGDGEVCAWGHSQISLRYKGKMHRLKTAVSSRLTHARLARVQ